LKRSADKPYNYTTCYCYNYYYYIRLMAFFHFQVNLGKLAPER